jgi:hypothetical protein
MDWALKIVVVAVLLVVLLVVIISILGGFGTTSSNFIEGISSFFENIIGGGFTPEHGAQQQCQTDAECRTICQNENILSTTWQCVDGACVCT